MRLIRLNLVVIASLALLISTVVGQPGPGVDPEQEVDPEPELDPEQEVDSEPEVDPVEQLASFRQNLRTYQRDDECRHKPWDEEDECTWSVNDRRAKRNCRKAMNAFLSLTNEEIDRVCPEAQQAKCRRCGKARYECTFRCRPSLSERNADLAANRPINLRLKCKHLSTIVSTINR